MKPINQTVFGFPFGNCYAACIASILEMPIEEMPVTSPTRHFTAVWWEWLSARGMCAIDVRAGSGAYIPGYCIASGDSPRGGTTPSGRPVQHAVVCHDMQIVHDPHPDRSFLLGPVKEYTVLTALDPRRLPL